MAEFAKGETNNITYKENCSNRRRALDMKRFILLIICCCLICGCATDVRYYKPGMTDEQFRKDSYDAHTIANQNARNTYGDNLNALGVILESNAVDAEYRRCMEQKFGYTFIDSSCTKVFNSGFAYLNKKEYDKAISDFTKAIEIDPNYPFAYANRGLAYTYRKDLTRAILDYNKAIELEPKLAVYTNRGCAYANQGNISQAISDFTKAIELNPNDAYAYTNRGLAYASQKNFAQAISDSAKAIEINPKYAEAYYSRGLAYCGTKEYDKAQQDMHKAQELGYVIDPKILDAIKKTSESKYSVVGSVVKIAEEAYSKGCEYSKNGNYDQAISEYTKAIEINPNYEQAYGNRGGSYANHGNLPKAISDYTKAIELNPKDVMNYYNRGTVYKDQGDLAQAASDFTKAIEIDPNYFEAYNNRVIVYRRLKEYDKAWADVHKTEGLGHPVDPRVLADLKKASVRDK